MTKSHAIHVYQPGNLPQYHENTPAAQYVVYGQDVSGYTFRDVFIHDAAADEKQVEWLNEELVPRKEQGGYVRFLASPSPVSGPKVSER